jgi:hypothetical protein
MWKGEGRITVRGNIERVMVRTSNHLANKIADLLKRAGFYNVEGGGSGTGFFDRLGGKGGDKVFSGGD